MGNFRVACIVETLDRSRRAELPALLVDTGSAYTWVSEKSLEKLGIKRERKDLAFVMANGQQVTRSVGYAIVRVDGTETVDEIVFAEPGDLELLGARSLEGLNLRVDTVAQKLVAAGPILAAPSIS
jgi:predicted aspartyl protease